jgi:hypothetical protein
MPTGDDAVADHVSAAFRRENVAYLGAQEEIERIATAGPRGAVVLAAVAVAVLLAIWIAFFVLVYLPRGAIA